MQSDTSPHQATHHQPKRQSITYPKTGIYCRVPCHHGSDPNRQNGPEHFLFAANHFPDARTFSGAQACITACVDAISGRAEMTRTSATSRPSASLANASAAPSGLP